MIKTIAAIATGQAPGGLGVIRVSGPESFKLCEKIFCPSFGRKLSDMPGYTAALGEVKDSSGEKLDDCVALVFHGPKSYTGEDVVELSCHGGLYVIRRILEELFRVGAVPAGPGEFTRRAFLNGKLDLAQAESVMETIGAQNRHAVRAAQAASSGVLSKQIRGICEQLQDLTAHLAAWADFPEEDVEIVGEDEVSSCLLAVLSSLDVLIESFQKGQMFREGLKTVIVGRPNVGKSTLMNLLVGRERSIVTPFAGTTRDVVEDQISLAGVPLLLADTAGLRDTEDPVEKIGVAAAKKRLEQAELILAVFDGSQEWSQDDFTLVRSMKEIPVIAVVNKSDLEQKLDLALMKQYFSHWVLVSADQGIGLEQLEQVFSDLLGVRELQAGTPELFTERQYAAALSAKSALQQGLEAMSLGLTLDAVTVCVEDALNALFQLTGQRVSDQVIDQVFEQFCVGK